MKLRIAVGLAALSVLFSAVSLSAAPVILICQPSNSGGSPFRMTVDSDLGTVEFPEKVVTQVKVTDAQVTFRLSFANVPPGYTGYYDGMLDRVTAVYSQRPCDSAQNVCGSWYISQCHKGEKQF